MRTHHVLLIALLALLGCADPLGEARAQFEAGQYPLAKQRLARLEAQARTWGARERAEYALYRGLSYGALGDEARARVWLGAAKAMERSRPGTLAADEVRKLEVAVVTYDVR